MKIEQIARVLDGVKSVKKEGAAWVIPDDVELSVFIALPSEVLAVPRCSRIDSNGDVLSLETHKGERFWFPIDVVAGLKSAVAETRAAGRGAGFR